MVTKPNTPTAEDAATIDAITNIVTRAYRIVENYSIAFGGLTLNESLADDLADITGTIIALAGHYGIALVGNPVDDFGDRYAADPAARGGYLGVGDPYADAMEIAERLRALADNAMSIGRDLYADVKTAQLADLAEIIEDRDAPTDA